MRTFVIPIAIILYFVCIGSRFVEAQHRDISLYLNADGEITVHDTGIDSQPELSFVRRDFDFWGEPPFGLYGGDDPGLRQSGLNPPEGFSALPGQMIIDIELMPFHIPGVPASNMLFWDGVGTEVEFTPLPQDHVLFIEDAASSDFEVSGSLERVNGLKGGITDASGGVHEHLGFLLENDGSTPADGYYAMGWQFSGDGVNPSRLTLIVLSTPGLPGEVDGMMDDWMADNVDQIKVVGDFDANFEYTLEDIDALVAAIAGGSTDPSFDLNGDGSVDRSDLTFWREVAGSVNNASGGAFLVGDANLDGVVDVSDFNIWNTAKFTSTAAWSSGDFNADGVIDVSDFNAWNTAKFQTSDAAAVPEPSGTSLLLFMGFVVAACSRLRFPTVIGR